MSTAQRKRSKRVRAARPEDQMLKTKFTELIEINKSQMTRPLPGVPDVELIRLKPNKVYTFCQSGALAAIPTSTSIEVDGALVFTLNTLPSAPSITSLFDQYRIRQINVKFIPTNAPGPSTTSTYVYTVIDYDDATPIPAASLVQYDNLLVTPAGQFFERTFNPRLAVGAYSGAFTSFANLSSSTWIDAASPNVQYYGLKYAIPATATATTIIPIVTFILECRQPR